MKKMKKLPPGGIKIMGDEQKIKILVCNNEYLFPIKARNDGEMGEKWIFESESTHRRLDMDAILLSRSIAEPPLSCNM